MHHGESDSLTHGNPANRPEGVSDVSGSDATGLSPVGRGRRTFIGAAAAALFAGVAIQITGCSTDDKGDAGNPSASGDKSGVVTGNHPAPHKAVITKAQLDADGSVTLDIQGDSDHTHSVTFNADQVATIKSGGHAMTSSTVHTPPGGIGHAHQVMFN